MPRSKPPFPAVRGLFDKPTTVNNVETLANVQHVITGGHEWYKDLALTPEAERLPESFEARWRGWYRHFPWEDHHTGRPALLDREVMPRLTTWAAGNPERLSRAEIAFGVGNYDWPDEAVAALGLDARTALVLLTHDPKLDDPALAEALLEVFDSTRDDGAPAGNVDTLDLLLLHRPDYLFNAAEVATALETLHENGRVRHFGVSNFRTSQVKLLQSQCPWPLLVNQVEINLHNIDALDNGVLDQCQRRKITPQAWSPLGGVAFEAWSNTFTPEDEARIRTELEHQAEVYGAEPWLLALAWLLKHPAGIQPIIGSTTPARIAAAAGALNIPYRREDWYRLLEARTGRAAP